MLADRGIPLESVQVEIISAFQSGFKQLKFPEMPPILASDRSWRATPQLDFEKSTVIAICKSWDPRERPQPRPVIVELSADEINQLWPVTVPRDRKGAGGRPPVLDWSVVKDEFLRLMDHHNEFSADDPDWNAVERLYEALHRFCTAKFSREVGRTTLQEHVTPWLSEWRAAAGS